MITDENLAMDTEEFIKNLMTTPRVVALKERAKKCRCKYCGAKLHLKQIVYNNTVEPRIEIYCDNCQRIEYGVEPEIYDLAKYYIDELGFDFYPDLNAGAMKDRMNIAKVCEIIFWALNGLGFVDMEGFKYPVEMDKNMVGESIVYDLDELEETDNLIEKVYLGKLEDGEFDE